VETKATEPEQASTSSIERLLREEGRTLWRALYAFTGGRRDITEEAVSEAFARAIRYRTSIREPLGWIYRTAFRVAARDLKREQRRPSLGGSEPSPPPYELDELMDALRLLPPNQRAAIMMHYLGDLPVRDVARRLGISPATVRVHLHRGRGRLRELLGSQESGDD
jgi:RNA polymerase sigma-70 factor (ECF subfamily)